MTEGKHTGGCRCGAVRFEAGSQPENSTVCYCRCCQRSFGAASVAWLTFGVADFTWTKDKPADYESSPGATWRFCANCGTSLAFTNERNPNVIDIATAAMDDPEAFPPRGIVFPGQKLGWDVCLDKPIFHDEK